MKARLQKWGNSLVLHIPKPFAAEAGIYAETVVELLVVQGQLVVRPLPQGPLPLDDLLRDVTDENLHREWDTGPAVGEEIW